MKKNALLGFGASALVIMALSACGGATASPEPAAGSASETATPTPTPVKKYTNEELVSVAGQIKEADGSSRAVISGQDIVAQYEPIRVLNKATIEPAECADLGTLGMYQPLDGATSAGTTRAKTGEFITSVALTSGVEPAQLQASLDKSTAHIEACKKMTLSAEGDTMTASTEKIDGVGTVPGTVASKTLMTIPGGRTGAIYNAYVLKNGVLISGSASSSEAATGGPEALGALMDQAAALIK
ncbi:hypothetical protein IRJ34_20390 [Paenarthrobacter sp. GOM3]|uniref:hypothetical protein n=1 Tax=Paenarthrobacter sp. GOM3 TaxID=2782567 RepID=UPI001BAD4045|nr:hypothetical protein [Paenarthrobacter sp. GOM3]WOH18681.1 hypothetical protein IRJ34_20390 [Paenarthrobacter sp. GOM3]